MSSVVPREDVRIAVIVLLREGVLFCRGDAYEAALCVGEVRVEADVGAGKTRGSEAHLAFLGQNSMDRRRPQRASSRAAVKLIIDLWYQSMVPRQIRKKFGVTADRCRLVTGNMQDEVLRHAVSLGMVWPSAMSKPARSRWEVRVIEMY